MNFLFCTPQRHFVFVSASNFLFFIPLYSPLFSPIFALLFLSSFSFTFCPPFSLLFFFSVRLYLFFKIFLSFKKRSPLFPILFLFSFFFPFFSSFFFHCFPLFINRSRRGNLFCPIVPQDRVVWDVLCKAWLLSLFFSVIVGRVEGVRLVSVWSSWGERESAEKKQIQKPSSSPAAHLGEEEEEQCRSKRHHFGLLLSFFFKWTVQETTLFWPKHVIFISKKMAPKYVNFQISL
jgi:hypothetical protein